MTFKVREDRNFNDSGKVYTAPVVARKLNGYMVLTPDKERWFLSFDDIKVLNISEEEKNLPIEW